MSSSGHARKIVGMKSIKIWVIEREVMKRTAEIGEIVERGSERRIAETRFICMPGRRPVVVPIRIPKTNAKVNSSIIVFPDNFRTLYLRTMVHF